MLLDRDAQLRLVIASFDEARSGVGSSLVVRGEAGCGKTSLVRAALAQVGDRVRVVWTACEPLATPRPLAPITDARRQLMGDQPEDGAQIARLFAALHDQPTALVIEDLHWADDATLDVVTRLAARMSATQSVLVVTYRPSEADRLRGVLGQLARTESRHVETPPLTRASVATLAAAAGRDGEAVFELTAGVPFLVTAVLAASGTGLPSSATDAVLASTASLDAAGLNALETMSCVPRVSAGSGSADTLVPFAVLDRAGVQPHAIEAAELTGLIEVGPSGAAFRHELGRLAVESTLSGMRRRALHIALRDAFLEVGAESAVVAHHALGAGDDPEIIDACDAAALLAVASGAHREACELLAHAVAAARRSRDARLVDLAERSARQRYLTNDLVGAIEHQRLALGVLLAAGDPERVAASHVKLARYCWFCGDRTSSSAHLETALAVLGDRPGTEALAEVLTARCQLAMLAGDGAVAEQAAVAAFDALGPDRRPDLRSSLLTNIGTLRLMSGDRSGLVQLQASMDVTVHTAPDEFVRGCANAAYTLTELRQLREAEPHLARGISYSFEHELDTWGYYMVGIRARWRLLHGNTTAALDDVDLVEADERNDLNRILPGLVRGLIDARSGLASADGHLADALVLTRRFGEGHRIGPVLAAIAERAWLQQSDEPVDQLVQFLDRHKHRVPPTLRGEIAGWLARLGARVEVDCVGTPHACSLAGEHQRAAALWGDLHVPYDRALALIDDGEPASLLEARRICDPLGASATVRVIDGMLARSGVPIPRGPRPTTKGNVALLTSRQLDVLDLMAGGRTNAQIADELFISVKTAGHHVSAILTKLGASRRTEAVAIAQEHGLVHWPRS